MSRRLVIRIKEDSSIRYGYETGLKAVYEALSAELCTDVDDIRAEIVEE